MSELQWVPLPDGEKIEVDFGGDNIGIARPKYIDVLPSGRLRLWMSSLSMAGEKRYGQSGKLPTGVRLCRQAPASAPTAPDEVRETLRGALEGERAKVESLIDGWKATSTTYKRYMSELTRIDEALSWLEGGEQQ